MEPSMNIYPITREQFEPVRAVLAANRKQTRPRIHDLYDVFSAILYREQNAISWRNLPSDVFPPWRTVHEYHAIWTMPPRDGGEPLLNRVKAMLTTR
jgi:transposase